MAVVADATKVDEYRCTSDEISEEDSWQAWAFLAMVWAVTFVAVACVIECRLRRTVAAGIAKGTASPTMTEMQQPLDGGTATAAHHIMQRPPVEGAAYAASTGCAAKEIPRERRLMALQRATVSELRNKLRWRWLPIGGVKSDLVQRLCDAKFERSWISEDGVSNGGVGRASVRGPSTTALRSDAALR